MIRKKSNYFILLLVFVAFYFVIFSILSFLRYKSFMCFEWQCEALRNNLMFNNSHGYFFNTFRPGVGTRHIELIEFLFLPIYSFFPSMITLYLIQTFFIAITAIPIYFLSFELTKSQKIAFWFALSFLFWAPVYNLNFSRFGWILLAPFFMVLNYFYFYKKKFRKFFLSAAVLLIIREDLILYFAFFLLYVFIKDFKQGRWFLLLSFLCIVFFCMDFFLIRITTKSLMLLDRFYVPEPITMIMFRIKERLLNNFHIIFKLLFPVNFLGFLVPECILILPALFLLLLSREGPTLIPTNIHYLTMAIPTIFIALIMFFDKFTKRLDLKNKEKIVFIIFLLNLLTIFTPNILGKLVPDKYYLPDGRFVSINNILNPVFFMVDNKDMAAWQIMKLIPANSSLACTGDLLPALSNRQTIFEYPISDDEIYKEHVRPQYYMLNLTPMFFGAGHTNYDFYFAAGNRINIQSIIDNDYFLVTSNLGYYLLRDKRM